MVFHRRLRSDGRDLRDELYAVTEADTVALRADVMAALAARPPCVLARLRR